MGWTNLSLPLVCVTSQQASGIKGITTTLIPPLMVNSTTQTIMWCIIAPYVSAHQPLPSPFFCVCRCCCCWFVVGPLHRMKADALRDDENVFDVSFEGMGTEEATASATDVKVCVGGGRCVCACVC